jgi:hypothetical protein
MTGSFFVFGRVVICRALKPHPVIPVLVPSDEDQGRGGNRPKDRATCSSGMKLWREVPADPQEAFPLVPDCPMIPPVYCLCENAGFIPGKP